MRTLIAYATRYGTARRCAEQLAARIGGQSQVVELGRGQIPPLEDYDTVIVGGSIYAGRIQPAVAAFCDTHRTPLLARRVGLYICCLFEGEKAGEELHQSFPAWLTAHAFAAIPLGGRVDVERLRWLDRLIYRKIARMNEGIDRILDDRIEELARAARGAT